VFDDDAFIKLRRDLALYYYPNISKGKDIVIEASFKFPLTPEGEAKLAEFKKHIASGDNLEIEGEFIEKFDFPDWWTRLFGEHDPSEMLLKVGPPKNPPVKPFQFDFFSPELGNIRLPQVDLRLEKGGQDEITVSNAEQRMPIKIIMVINHKTKQLQISVTFHFNNVDGYQAKKAIGIWQILSSAPSEIRIKDLENELVDKHPVPERFAPPPHPGLVDIVEKVCFIQDETGITLTFPEDDPFREEDVIDINELVHVLRRGILKHSGRIFSAKFSKPVIEALLPKMKAGDLLAFHFVSDESRMKILDREIKLGPITQHVKGTWDGSYEEVKRWVETASDKDTLELTIENAETIAEFENWPRKRAKST
jgi:hypothetical protein